jgi:hypothetical protein
MWARIRRRETAISPPSQPVGGWPGRQPLATINAADETRMGRWKRIIGPKRKARGFETPKTEAETGVRVLNRMTRLGRPSFERTA